MRCSRLLATIALITFVVAHALPAFAGASGLRCEGVVWSSLFQASLEKVYFSSFALTNALFVVLAIIAFAPRPRHFVVQLLSVAMLLHVLSWLVITLFWYATGEEETFQIQVGYFLWAAAFGLLTWALCQRSKEQRP